MAKGDKPFLLRNSKAGLSSGAQSLLLLGIVFKHLPIARKICGGPQFVSFTQGARWIHKKSWMMLGDFSFIYWTFSQKLFFWGGCRTWCNSLSKVAWLKYVENMAPVTQYDSKCQTRKTHQPSIGIIHPAHVSLSGCCKRQRFNIDTKNDAFKKNSISC